VKGGKMADPFRDPEFQTFAEVASEWNEQALGGAHGASGATFDQALSTGLAGRETPQQVAVAWTLICLADPTFPRSEEMLAAISAERARQAKRRQE
jgi:hypothetical protein